MFSEKTLKKVISGGQSGADLGALKAAKALGIETGGTAPKNYMTEFGPNYSLKTEYNLIENHSISYKERSIKNIENADGIIAFRIQRSTGTDKSIGYAQSKKWEFGVLKTMNKEETK